MPTRSFAHLLILASLLCAAGSAFAKKQKTQPGPAETQPGPAETQPALNPDVSAQMTSERVWRCSFDSKYYTVTYANGLVISPIGSGQVSANIPFRTDKKGRSKLEGQWGPEGSSSLVVIQAVQQGYVGGHMFVPAPGVPGYACASRKSAVILSIGQPRPVCDVASVSWTLEPNLSPAQLTAAEFQGDVQSVYAPVATAPAAFPQGSFAPGSVDNSLVGTWSNESATAVSYMKTSLVLRADGTYTKTFGARPPSMGGGEIGAHTWGDTHSGTWSVAGPLRVLLSGDSQHTPYTQDLGQLIKR